MQENNHDNVLTIEQMKTISVTGVTAVNGFSPSQIALTLPNVRLIISGSNLKIADFSKESGRFTATGNIAGVKYVSSAAKFKLFK